MSAHLLSIRGPPGASRESDQDSPLDWQEGGSGGGGPITLIVPFDTPAGAVPAQAEQSEALADSVRGEEDDAAAAAAARKKIAAEAIKLKISFRAPAYDEMAMRPLSSPHAIATEVDGREDAATTTGARFAPAFDGPNGDRRRRGPAVDNPGGSEIGRRLHAMPPQHDVFLRLQQQHLGREQKRREESQRKQGEQQQRPPKHAEGVLTGRGSSWGAIRTYGGSILSVTLERAWSCDRIKQIEKCSVSHLRSTQNRSSAYAWPYPPG